MQLTNTFRRRLAPTVVLALIVLAAFGAGAAGAAGGSEGKPAVQAEEFVPGVTDFPSRLGEAGERAAEQRLGQRSLDGPVVVQTEASGFDWSAATTGALAATLLLLGAALAVRVGRRSSVAVG
jgi:hypothetical protein